ncbi:hypothetical protein GGH93_005948 [Coemansia aciculifera]|nr:hypothetical protein GGH93_005948 [Coemansia aciculifera]
MSSTPSTPWDGVAIIRVRFPDRSICEDCTATDYEDIVINARTAKVGQVKDAIATKLGIETDEFVFEYKYDTTKYECELDEQFANIYMRSNYLASLLKGNEEEPFIINLCENKDYKGKTGLLNWILRPKMDLYCSKYNTGGQLAKRLARHVAAYKAHTNTTSTSSVPNVEDNTAQE